MKKFIKVLAVLAFCITLSTITFAASEFSDVKNTKYSESVKNLVEVGLVNGFPDGSFGPGLTVTRAQMAKMLIIALGKEDQVSLAANESNKFTDMASTHWAYGYINVAQKNGIIMGYLDGSFKPDATVTYSEATAMAVRALGYDDEVKKSTENWPNNYINYAKKLNLYENLGTVSAGNNANRGDAAIILWNMLRTGVCTAVSQTGSTINYGQGQKMLNKYKNFVYLNDAEVTTVTFAKDNKKATVTINGGEKLTLTMDATDALKYYGRKVDILYNTKSKKIISIDDTKDFKVITGDVEKVTSSKITIDDVDYTLPSKSNILLYRADSIKDAVEATIIKDGSKVIYVIASGARDVEIGLVVETDVKINKDYGIKIRKLDSTTKISYVLVDEDDMPEKDSVILYYLNSDDELGIVEEFNIEEALEIDSFSTKKNTIKLDAKTYTYDAESYTVISANSSTIKKMDFEDIDEDEDMAIYKEYADEEFLIIFTDAYKSEEEKEKQFNEMKKYRDGSTIKGYYSNEQKYSQSTYQKFYEAYNEALDITSKSTAAKISSAYSKLKETAGALKSVSSTSDEGKIAALRKDIRAMLAKGKEIVKDKALYEATSYKKFETEYNAVNKYFAKADYTLKEAQNAYDALKGVIDVKKVVESEEHKAEVTNLANAINACKVTTPADYTETTYKAYKTAYDNAIAVQKAQSTKTVAEIQTAIKNLEEAYGKLEFAQEALKDELGSLIANHAVLESKLDLYFKDTVDAYEDAYEDAVKCYAKENVTSAELKTAVSDLKAAEKGLKLISTELTKYETEANKIKATALETKGVLENTSITGEARIEAIYDAVKADLKSLADSEEENEKPDVIIARGNALKIWEKSTSTIENLVKAYIDFKAVIDANK